MSEQAELERLRELADKHYPAGVVHRSLAARYREAINRAHQDGSDRMGWARWSREAMRLRGF
jgi:hypothetical protein